MENDRLSTTLSNQCISRVSAELLHDVFHSSRTDSEFSRWLGG